MPPIGVVIGYALTSYITLNGGLWEYTGGEEGQKVYYWYQSFRLQCYLNFISASLIFFIPRKFLNINDAVKLKRQFIQQRDQNELEDTQNGPSINND